MSDAVTALAGGMGTLATANDNSQTTTALWLISLMNCVVPLTQNYTETLKADQNKYFADSLAAGMPGEPNMAAQAAADYMQYSQDSTQMDTATGKLNTMIGNGKSQVQGEGQAMDQIYNLMEPLAQVLRSTAQSIMRIS